MTDPHLPGGPDEAKRPGEPAGADDVEMPRALPVEEIFRPRKPRTLGGAIYLGVLAVTGLALVLVGLDRWREGLMLMGGAMLVAALARAVIRDEDSGMLGLRRKPVDIVTMVLLGSSLVVLSAVIPGQAPV